MLVSARPAGQAVGVALCDLDKAILEFERTWWTLDGVKDDLIEQRFGLSPSAYYEALNGLLDDPEALAHDPLVVRRLRRLRDRRRRERLDAVGRGGER